MTAPAYANLHPQITEDDPRAQSGIFDTEEGDVGNPYPDENDR